MKFEICSFDFSLQIESRLTLDEIIYLDGARTQRNEIFEQTWNKKAWMNKNVFVPDWGYLLSHLLPSDLVKSLTYSTTVSQKGMLSMPGCTSGIRTRVSNKESSQTVSFLSTILVILWLYFS